MSQDPRRDLVAAIQAVLGVTPASLSQTSPGSDLYELYVFSLVLTAARDLNATVSFEDVHGNIPQMFVARTSPGYIYSDEQPYCHALIRLPRCPPLEAHLGIRVEGASGVLHECDVAVLLQATAAMCRQGRFQPRQSQVILAAECKFYTVPIPLGLARGFVGLTSDLPGRDRYFVFNSTNNNIERFLSARTRHWERSVRPNAPREVDRLRNAFQTTFRDFTARRGF
jgi:hypothetical protein